MKFTGPQASGSVGSLVYSRNRGGQYTRNRVHPAQPAGTGRRATVRSWLAASSSGWTSLGSDLQAQWDSVAAAHPRTNAIGQRLFLTGQQLFIGVSVQLLNVGGSVATFPPTDFRVFSEFGASLSIDGSGNIACFASGLGSPQDFALVAVSAPVSQGRRTWFTWWQINVSSGDSGGPGDVTAQYNSQFGLIPSGKRVFAKFTPVNQFGLSGVPVVTFFDAP